jgi:hypothetical protein
MVLREFERVGLPNEPGRALVERLCAGCHAPAVVTGFRLPEQAWPRDDRGHGQSWDARHQGPARDHPQVPLEVPRPRDAVTGKAGVLR